MIIMAYLHLLHWLWTTFTTDKYIDIFLKMFKNKGIAFNKSYIIDNRITSKDAIEYINKSEIVWISGGDTLKQIRNIKEYNLIKALQNRKGITIGISAGAINMAKKVVLAKYVDINVEPHLDFASEEHMNEIYRASQHTAIYGIYDNSFIKIVNESIEIYGTYFKYENIAYK